MNNGILIILPNFSVGVTDTSKLSKQEFKERAIEALYMDLADPHDRRIYKANPEIQIMEIHIPV